MSVDSHGRYPEPDGEWDGMRSTPGTQRYPDDDGEDYDRDALAATDAGDWTGYGTEES